MAYTKYKRGSEWRKWDLHIHTPGTKKNDQFEGANIEEKWQGYVEAINTSAEDISVVGVTDYFSIENYFVFKEKCRAREITKQFDLIVPNIELRVLPVTGSSTPINLHCIFNPAIDTEIESRFLSKLKFDYSESSYSATKAELVRLGKNLENNQALDNEVAYKKGIEQYVISLESLRTVFKDDPSLRENVIIVVSNKSSDGVTGIVRHEDFFVAPNGSQLDATRQSFYQFSDAIFSSSESDKRYFVGKGADDEKTLLRKCGSLKPCFHGSDAHRNDRVFNPDNSRFCWIKADPTFEGLKQTLYEPEDRVMIQPLKPDVKNERYLISELQFIDSGNLFGNQTILLNENLNAIIGGKSSGKSLLLFSSARSTDPEQVDRTSKRLGFDGYQFDSPFDFKVVWKNGDEDLLSNSNLETKLHKITYIPQLYINYLVEKNNKEDLNLLIKNILLQDSSFRSFYENTKQEISNTSSEIDRLLSEFLRIRNKGLEVQQKSKEIGNSENIKNGIIKIEETISQGQKALNLSESEFETYNKLLAEKSILENESRNLTLKESILTKIIAEVSITKSNLLGKEDISSSAYLKGQVDRILDEFGEIPQDVLLIRQKMESDFELLIANINTEVQKLDLPNKQVGLSEETTKKTSLLAPYLEKIAGQKELLKLIAQLDGEKEKYQTALLLETQVKSLLEEYANIRIQIVAQLKYRHELYLQVTQTINSSKKNIGSDIELTSTLIYKIEKFRLFEQTNKAAISKEHYFNTLFNNGVVNYDAVLSLYETQLKVTDDKLLCGEQVIPLKNSVTLEDVLEGLIKDEFEIDHLVTYKNDDLLHMSPGKKGTVLLILFLQISSSEFPILIDQPEDNLDNRTIYDLLCKIIKEKKKDRQVIIVSHNANLVVATDTENIIVANQNGQGESQNLGSSRFEYVNGALEHSFRKNENVPSVLECQGIREHVCDILEGGGEAFKQREKKYSIRV